MNNRLVHSGRVSARFPCRPCPFIDSRRRCGLPDGPASCSAEGRKTLGQRDRSRVGIIAKEGDDLGIMSNFNFPATELPVDDGLVADAQVLSDLALIQPELKAPPLDVIADRDDLEPECSRDS